MSSVDTRDRDFCALSIRVFCNFLEIFVDINKTKLHYNSWVSIGGEPVACVSFLGAVGVLAVGPTWVPLGGEGRRGHLVPSAVAGTLLTFPSSFWKGPRRLCLGGR